MATTTFKDVLQFLSTCSLTTDESNQLVRVWNANIKRQRAAKREAAIAQFRVGQQVSFLARGGISMTGVIEKVMRVNCWVRTPAGQRFYCPSTCLRSAG